MNAPALLPQEIIYARKPMEDIRSSLVAIPVYLPNLSIKKKNLKEILGYAINVYRLKIPFQRGNLALNNIETRMLIHYIHRIVAKLFEEKFPWKGKTNVSKKEIKKIYKEFQIHSQGKIQKSINQLFQFIQKNPIQNYPLKHQLSIENIPRLFNDYGYYYFTLSVAGTVESETSLGSAATSIKQFTTPAISINRIATTDQRLITTDSQVRSPESLLTNYYMERYGNLRLHLAFPWIKDFLLTYLSGVVRSIKPDLLNLVSEEQYQTSIKRNTKMEVVQKTCKPNTSHFKDSLQSTRKELFYQSIQQEISSPLSQLIQMILCNFDAVPINRTERYLLNADTSVSTFAELPTTIDSHKNKRRKVQDEEKEISEKPMESFLSQLEELRGREEILCSAFTRKQLKIARLITHSEKLAFNRCNPVRGLRLMAESQVINSRSFVKPSFPGSESAVKQSSADQTEDSQVLMNELYGVHSNQSSSLRMIKELSRQSVKIAHAPSSSLMTLIRETFCEKISHRSDDYLENAFDASALQAIAVFTEEAILEMLRFGAQAKQPLLFSHQSLSAEIYAQMNGSSRPEAIDPEVLRQRLELLFGRSLLEYQEVIRQKRQEFIDSYSQDLSTIPSESREHYPQSLASLNYHLILPENRGSISVREKEVEEYDIKYPILSDAKRQLQGDKRTNYDGFPEYFFPEEIEKPVDKRKRKREANAAVMQEEDPSISTKNTLDDSLMYTGAFDGFDTEVEDD